MYIVSAEEEKRLQWEGSRICRKGRFYVSQSIRTFLFLRRRLGALAAEVPRTEWRYCIVLLPVRFTSL